MTLTSFQFPRKKVEKFHLISCPSLALMSILIRLGGYANMLSEIEC